MIQRTSSIASSMSLRKIWPIPARRSGNSPHQSTSQRLCAADPGQPVLVRLGGGLGREEDEVREEGRHGVGEHHFSDHVVAFLVAVALLVVPVADAVVGGAQVLVGVLVLVAPRVEVLEVLLLEVLAIDGVARAGVAVGRDDRVVVRRLQVCRIERGGRRHGWVPRLRVRRVADRSQRGLIGGHCVAIHRRGADVLSVGKRSQQRGCSEVSGCHDRRFVGPRCAPRACDGS